MTALLDHSPIIKPDPTADRDVLVQVLADLDALGSSDAIAEHLAEAGVKGLPACPTMCAVAVYLHRFLLRPIDVCVANAYLVDENQHATHEIPLPGNVEMFVRNFDSVRYPDLISR